MLSSLIAKVLPRNNVNGVTDLPRPNAALNPARCLDLDTDKRLDVILIEEGLYATLSFSKQGS